MSVWPSTKAKQLLKALERQGWHVVQPRGGGSHRILVKEGYPSVPFAFHDKATVGRAILAKIAKVTGLTPEDL